jgi:hypothetical protein
MPRVKKSLSVNSRLEIFREHEAPRGPLPRAKPARCPACLTPLRDSESKMAASCPHGHYAWGTTIEGQRARQEA